jgi:carbamoyl-phosphate synthase large subunit
MLQTELKEGSKGQMKTGTKQPRVSVDSNLTISNNSLRVLAPSRSSTLNYELGPSTRYRPTSASPCQAVRSGYAPLFPTIALLLVLATPRSRNPLSFNCGCTQSRRVAEAGNRVGAPEFHRALRVGKQVGAIRIKPIQTKSTGGESTRADSRFVRTSASTRALHSGLLRRIYFCWERMNADILAKAKSLGFSDRQIAHLTGKSEDEVRALRKKLGLVPSYRLVDTCAAEFEAYTPYYYSTYDRGDDEVRGNSDKKKVMILGGGPNRIGQGIEFDYCCVHAAFALKEDGFETLMVNSNPETVSTDYDTSDKLFFEPLTLEDVLHIYEREKCWGAIAQFGGQTPLNLALSLQKNGVNIIGTSPQSIEIAEDRKMFAAMLNKLKIPQPPNGLATNEAEALEASRKLGYPVLVRPSFVLGGRAMQIVYSDSELQHYMRFAVEASPERPVLVDKFLEDATEVDVDCIADVGHANGGTIVMGGMLEHIEFAGVHSGDAAMVLPPHSLSQKVIQTIREYTHAMARELKVIGLMNVQYAVKGETVYCLEVNPRASRTVPFVSKAIGFPLAKLAAKVMAGKTLKELGFTEEVWPKYWTVKESVFPFNRFHGQDILLSPEMRSTGEVMGLDVDLGIAYAKSQMAANAPLPLGGRVFISVSDAHKNEAAEVARDFEKLGFELVATAGTAAVLEKAGLKVQRIFKLTEGRPNAIDLLKNKEIQLVINTPAGQAPRADEVKIRTTAVYTGTPIMTTLSGAKAAALGIAALKKSGYGVKTLQEYH